MVPVSWLLDKAKYLHMPMTHHKATSVHLALAASIATYGNAIIATSHSGIVPVSWLLHKHSRLQLQGTSTQSHTTFNRRP
jgi:hypothetical protein